MTERKRVVKPLRPVAESLHARLVASSNDRNRRAHDAWVERVLAVLGDDALAATAGAATRTERVWEVECGFAHDIWEDPRIVQRVRALDRLGIGVTVVDVERTIAGRDFSRPRLRIEFGQD